MRTKEYIRWARPLLERMPAPAAALFFGAVDLGQRLNGAGALAHDHDIESSINTRDGLSLLKIIHRYRRNAWEHLGWTQAVAFTGRLNRKLKLSFDSSSLDAVCTIARQARHGGEVNLALDWDQPSLSFRKLSVYLTNLETQPTIQIARALELKENSALINLSNASGIIGIDFHPDGVKNMKIYRFWDNSRSAVMDFLDPTARRIHQWLERLRCRLVYLKSDLDAEGNVVATQPYWRVQKRAPWKTPNPHSDSFSRAALSKISSCLEGRILTYLSWKSGTWEIYFR